MQSEAHSVPAEAERQELEAVAQAFGHSSRLASLLRYIGEKHFRGEDDQLSEYTIATEVFGRSRTKFDPSQDAIARVEAHRLRKKLKDFYENAGRDHPIHVSIAQGTYLPVFSRHDVPPSMASDVLRAPATSQNGNGHSVVLGTAAGQSKDENHDRIAADGIPPSPGRRDLIYVLLALALPCILLAGLYWKSRSQGAVAHLQNPPRAVYSQHPAPSAATAPMPLRLLAGYSGEPQKDNVGADWEPDNYVQGGGPWTRPEGPIARTSDPLIFQHWRIGDCEYNIPLRPGVYELHLYFVASDSSSDNLSTFGLLINGTQVLEGFDINSDALGENVADERVFRDVSPASDGMLHLQFKSERGAPQISAIELLPGLPHMQIPIRIVTQRTSFTDHNGHFWHPDDYFMNGRLSDQSYEIAGSPDPGLFDMERYGHFTYALPVDPRDRYTLILHFVEFYFGPGRPGGGGVGSRIFRVMCNGETLLDNFDIFKEAGSLRVLTKTFYHLKPSAQGKLNLTFEPIVNNATVSGIEVLDESR